MNGSSILNTFCGSSSVHGLMDKNSADTKYRATALGWLNLIIKDIAKRQKTWHWRFLEKTATAPTVASQMDYDLPTDIDTNKIFAISDRTQDRTYIYVPYEKFIRAVADPSNSSGNSIWWTFWANVIKLYPVPDSVWTFYLNYVKVMTAASDNATALDIPDKYEPAVINGMLVYGYKFDPDMGDWRTQKIQYDSDVDDMVSENLSMIGSLPETASHRGRLGGRDLTEGNNSVLFPINQ